MALCLRSTPATAVRVRAQPAPPARMSRRASVQVQAFQVTLRMPQGTSKTLQVAEDESVMDAIDAAGLDLPYLCRTGTCGTCAGRVTSGTVEQSGQHLLDPKQAAAGFVLMCSTYPRSDCTIITHQEENLHVDPDAYLVGRK